MIQSDRNTWKRKAVEWMESLQVADQQARRRALSEIAGAYFDLVAAGMRGGVPWAKEKGQSEDALPQDLRDAVIRVMEQDGDPLVRAEACLALRCWRGTEAQKGLQDRAQNDPDPRVRLCAVHTLASMDVNDPEEFFTTIAEKTREDVRVRGHALSAIDALARKRASSLAEIGAGRDVRSRGEGKPRSPIVPRLKEIERRAESPDLALLARRARQALEEAMPGR